MEVTEAKKQLANLIENTVVSLITDGDVRRADVTESVIEQAGELVRLLGDTLAWKAVDGMVSDRLKHACDPPEQQMELPGIPGLPTALTYERDGEVFYIARSAARRKHYQDYLVVLEKNRARIDRSHAAVVRWNATLEPAREKHGDLPERELLLRMAEES